MPVRPSREPEILFRGLDLKEKEEFKRLLYHSALIDRLVEILKGWQAEVLTIPRDDYESPAWACKQADRNGELRTLNKVLQLLDHKE
jgi:hypothetical protein